MTFRPSPHVLGRRRSPFLRRVRRPLGSRAAIAACVAVAVTGAAALATMFRTDQGRDVAAPPPTSPRVLVRGPLGVDVPAGWRVLRDVPRVPGMDFSRPIAIGDPGSGVRLVAGFVTASSRTLMPASFVNRIRTAIPRPERVRLATRLETEHYFGVSHPGIASLLDVYVAPTSEGILTVACLAKTVASLLDHCFKGVSGLTLKRGWPLPAGPDAAFRDAMRGRVAELEAADAAVRRRLTRASTASEQVRAIADLSTAYEGAAGSLAPLSPRSPAWPRRIVRALGRMGAAYEGLERSVYGGGGDYLRARSQAIERRAELRRLLDRALSPES